MQATTKLLNLKLNKLAKSYGKVELAKIKGGI
jgi:hypothetical protein